jgi:hypothetical protein
MTMRGSRSYIVFMLTDLRSRFPLVDFIEESLGFNEEDHEMCIITSLLCFQNSVSELSYQGDNAHLMVFFIETQGFFDKVLALRSDFLFCRLELLKVSVKVTCFEISSAENTTLAGAAR